MTKLTKLNKIQTLLDDDLVYVVKPSNPVGQRSKGISKVDLANEIGGGGAVNSVNGKSGNVVLSADDISDAATTNKFVTNQTLIDVSVNNSKIGITNQQALDILNNNDKISYTDSVAVALNTEKVGVTNEQQNTINSTTAGEPLGSDAVLNVVSLTQAEYDAGTPLSTTFYIITDA